MKPWTTADIPSQAGRRAIVTGGNSGIGWHTALELARAGGEVILTARTEAKGKDAVERILARSAEGSLCAMNCWIFRACNPCASSLRKVW